MTQDKMASRPSGTVTFRMASANSGPAGADELAEDEPEADVPDNPADPADETEALLLMPDAPLLLLILPPPPATTAENMKKRKKDKDMKKKE